MANRYWVGNGGNWNDTAHWSSTDGGASGASVPSNTDDVFFTSNSITTTGQSINIPLNLQSFSVKTLDMSTVTNSPTVLCSGTPNYMLYVHQDLILSSGVTFGGSSGNLMTVCFTTDAYSTDKYFNQNGATLEKVRIYAGYIGVAFTTTLIFSSNVTINDQNGLLRIYRGSLNTGGYAVNVPIFWTYSSGSIGTLNFNNSTLTFKNFTLTSNVTTISSSGTTLHMTTPGNMELSKNMTVTNLNFSGSLNNYMNLYINAALTATTVNIYGGPFTLRRQTYYTTITTTNFNANGVNTSNLITLDGSSSDYTNMFSASGTVTCNYLLVRDCTVGGASTWFAGWHSKASGVTTGWIFPPRVNSVFFGSAF